MRQKRIFAVGFLFQNLIIYLMVLNRVNPEGPVIFIKYFTSVVSLVFSLKTII